MEHDDDRERASTAQPEVRLVLIGRRWAGKSASGNTILRKRRLECGRSRTAQCEVRHEEVDGRKLVVVDAPGWSDSLSLAEIPEGDKQELKVMASKCPPGPHAFLLVVPTDTAFSEEQRRTVEVHMKLLGSRAWRHTVVLFTCQDSLGEKSIEQHIESEGAPLRWLIERCGNRYHAFNNQEQSDAAQVTELLQKVDGVVRGNDGGYYEMDAKVVSIISEKQRAVRDRAEIRRRAAEEQAERMKGLLTEMKPAHTLRVVLLGSRGVGKSSLGNVILGIKAGDNGKRTTRAVAQQGRVGDAEVTVVDTPGWCKGFSASETPEAIKDELRRSVFLCPPGPHAFLLVLDADASFNANHREAVATHVELLGGDAWRRAVVVFTRGDWLGARSVEQFIEGEGEALRSLVDFCGNRYHVMENRNRDEGTQVTELLEKVRAVAGDGSDCFTPDEQILIDIEDRRRKVEERARRRENEVKAKRQSLRGSRNRLEELRIMMLGQKTDGKSATGNNLLRQDAFATCENERCQVHEASVAGRRIRVVDTPGWRKEDSIDLDNEIVHGLSLSPSGLHVVLLVVPLDLTFSAARKAALENQMSLFGPSVWKHTMVLFTYGDKLLDRTVEEHIERERGALRWLVDKCDNRYHVMDNTKRSDVSQVRELFEKVEELVAENKGQVFSPDVSDIHLRIEEKFERSRLKHVLKPRLLKECRRRELELMRGFRETLLELQDGIRGSGTGNKPMSCIVDMAKGRKKDPKLKKENIDAKISREIEKLEAKMMTSEECLGRSMEFLNPDFSGGSHSSVSDYDKVLGWLSKLHIDTNPENQLTLNFSRSSGYGSVLPKNTEHDQDFSDDDDI
ncbi:GTPase IMAP family member 8-like [Betta splendens]|uniref:GTPase IMAP family member 8-like n=1 Tax=Betta splendens TaxID=158456 RepID=A0A6P7M8B6_BETSP|nr:GTPase IMAP family member 8-like [Betta splendens]